MQTQVDAVGDQLKEQAHQKKTKNWVQVTACGCSGALDEEIEAQFDHD